MRKLVIVLVLLMAAGMVFAADASVYTAGVTADTGEASAKLRVVLPLSGDDFSSVVVGFTANPVSEYVDSFSEVKPLTEDIELVQNADKTSAELTSGLHAYWQVQTKNKVAITLGVSGALTGETDTSAVIDWQVTADDTSIGISNNEGNYSSTITLYTSDLSESVVRAQGSEAITIATADYAGKPIQDYSANILLNVKVGD